MSGTMTRTVFLSYRVWRLLLVFLTVITVSGTTPYTALEKYRPAIDGIQGNALQPSGQA